MPSPKGISTHWDGAGIQEPGLVYPSVERNTFAKRMGLLFGQCRPNKNSACVCGYKASSVRQDELVDYTVQFHS